MILDRFRLDGAVAVVTGAGRGIGRAVALGLADAGADVVVMDLSTNMALNEPEGAAAIDDRVLTLITQYREKYRGMILDALRHIDDVQVAVSVDLDDLQSKVMQSQKYDPKGSVPVSTQSRKRTEKSAEQPPRAEPAGTTSRSSWCTVTESVSSASCSSRLPR